jgi:hypothetical protein
MTTRNIDFAEECDDMRQALRLTKAELAELRKIKKAAEAWSQAARVDDPELPGYMSAWFSVVQSILAGRGPK